MLRQLKSAPNQLTLLRLVFIPFIALSVMEQRFKTALVLFLLAGISDALDGLIARWLNQKTVLGQYLDPIADKLLLSTMFLMLAAAHRIPWRITVVVFSRDFCILLLSGVLYITTSLRDFSPSIFGKANTVAQIITVFLVLLDEVVDAGWVTYLKHVGMWSVFALTLLSAVHYIILVGQRLRVLNSSNSNQERSGAA